MGTRLLAELSHGREQMLAERAAHERALGELTAQLKEAAQREQRGVTELTNTQKCLEETKNTLSEERLTFQHKMGELKEKVESLSQMMETTLARNRKLEHEL